MSYCEMCQVSGGCYHTDKAGKYEPQREIARLIAERDELRAQRAELTARAEAAEKQVAALRAALENVVTACSREWCGEGVLPDGNVFCEQCRLARAALAEPNLGSDWVQRAELEAQVHAILRKLDDHSDYWDFSGALKLLNELLEKS
jgi:hypothetical protein